MLSSCGKEEVIFIPDQEYVVNQDVLWSNFIAPPTSYIIQNTTVPNVIKTSNNHYIEIPANAFADQNGDIISGNIKISFDDLSTKPKLFSGPGSLYGQFIYEVAQLVHVRISKNGSPIQMIKTINIFISSEMKDQEYQLLEGVVSNESEFVWNPDPQSASTIRHDAWTVHSNESNIQGKGYVFGINNLDTWTAVVTVPKNDHETLVDICLTMPNTYTLNNTLTYGTVRGQNQIIRLDNTAPGSFCNENLKMHLGIEMVFFTISDLGNGKYYFAQEQVILGRENDIEMTPTIKSKEDISAFLSAL